MAGRSHVLLRIYLVGSKVADRQRAEQIVDGLASRRPVSAGVGEWRVAYDTEQVAEAMRTCEADLTDLDPSWLEILDFAALSSRPTLGIASE